MRHLIPYLLLAALVVPEANAQQRSTSPELAAQYAKLTREVELLRYRVGLLENRLRRETWEPTKESDPVIYSRMKPFLFNPAGTPDRICNTSIHLILASPEVNAFIEKRNLHVRLNDALLAFLASRTLEELTTGRFTELKAGVREQANRIVGKNAVSDVLFQDLVVQ